MLQSTVLHHCAMFGRGNLAIIRTKHLCHSTQRSLCDHGPLRHRYATQPVRLPISNRFYKLCEAAATGHSCKHSLRQQPLVLASSSVALFWLWERQAEIVQPEPSTLSLLFIHSRKWADIKMPRSSSQIPITSAMWLITSVVHRLLFYTITVYVWLRY